MATARAADRGGVSTATAADDLEGVLLRRLSVVYVAAPAEDGRPTTPGADAERNAERNAAGVTALEADLAGRGHVLTAPLRRALAALSPAGLAEQGIRLLGRIDALLGADRRHEPLFRGFPDAVPDHAHSLYSERILAFLLSQPHQPCLSCGRTGDIGALAPCAHLVCSACLAGSGRDEPDAPRRFPCPVCGAHPDDPGRPYPEPAERPRAAGDGRTVVVREGEPPAPLRPLRLGAGAGPRDGAAAVLADLLARRTPLPPRDRADLAALLPHADPSPDWLPAGLPVRETRAAVLAALLRREATAPAARALLPAHLDTATDVLRLLWAYSGGEPDLLDPPRLRSLPRVLRRELLGVLDALPPESVAEDMLRRRQAWQRAGEVLHPYEYRARFPRAAVAFAVVRGTDLSDGPNEWLLDAAAGLGERVRLVSGRPGGAVRPAIRTFASETERLLGAGDTAGATALLLRRPGELVRRLHRLLRVHSLWTGADDVPPGLLDALPAALRRVGPGPLLGAWGRLRVPHEAGERRVFFPRGTIALAHGTDDHAPPVPPAAAAAVCAVLEAELLRRAGESAGTADGGPGGTAVLDAALADLVVPFAERAAARTLVAVPRGSRRPLPGGDGPLRLFLHWTEPRGQRVDLDLSVALYDAEWRFTGLCDYTRLTFADRAAVHSGDHTSAPPPRGATEFVDLDPALLARAGARYAVMVVLSYNDVPFDELSDAFAGVMRPDGARTGGRSRPYDPRRVRQRFDLAGRARVCMPMVLDLAERTALWTDTNLSVAGGLHNVYRHRGRLGRLAADLTAHFAPGARATVWDLAARLAAAGSAQVWVRASDGRSAARYRRGGQEPVERFAARVLAGRGHDELRTGTAKEIGGVLAGELGADGRFAALVDGDLPARWERGDLYRLFPGPLDAGLGPDVRLLAAADLTTRFAPAAD
ncbi:MXAN_6230/SCO0854 family RING domain-containing protein [Streptomyces sp. TRM 70361]|uniref:MXAN_6230/SCO0854 family RING domain-containing protein n=1 Tax=Streptomyces sp. TRM 70361 TaxID=3116553 RepID=UPI002E7AF848|nr:MXAN_6230/SCO0854 family RING domain-containing protein [Streptomyces sp. TRM 70361]MEE1942319.1 MXAN_6230/SCO0854 family RING domain-containing protein [Streptomyces sp. TRM 70361]